MGRMHIRYCTNTEDHLLTSLSSTRLKYGKQKLNIDSSGSLSIFQLLTFARYLKKCLLNLIEVDYIIPCFT